MKTRAKSKRANSSTAALSTKKPAKSKAKKPSPSTAKDGHKIPKKPPTAFFYFLEDFRKTYQQENPDVKSMRDIGKACGEKWKTLSFELLFLEDPDITIASIESTIRYGMLNQALFSNLTIELRDTFESCTRITNMQDKVQYYDIATEKRAEFEQAMAAYIKRKESGEFSEESDDYD